MSGTGGNSGGTTTPRVTPGEFLRQVRQEVNKVTWPSRRETAITTALIFVVVFVLAIFFFLVDKALAFGVRLLLGLGA
ncbi:MAG: preprotein translocase subunit SecE [Alphaproteobacteria bacterium]|nr:preprotein translocase subunit SecE [Alphaproteobacteria bacterium]